MARIIEVEVDSINDCRILAPIISSAILLSHSIRKDTLLVIRSKRNDRSLIVDGRTVRNLRPDIESMCGLIRSALKMKTRYGIILRRGKLSYTTQVLFSDTGKGLNIKNAIEQYSGVKSYALYIGENTPYTKSDNIVNISYRRHYCIPQKIAIFNYILDLIEQGIKTWQKKA